MIFVLISNVRMTFKDKMNIDLQFKNFTSEDMSLAFEIYKSGLHNVIEEAFGWSEDYQLQRFNSRYKREWFHWIEKDLERIGYVCFNSHNEEVHISLLIINQHLRSKGYGKQVMLQIHEMAQKENYSTVTLSSFKNNLTAVKFYIRLGYQIINEDEYFLDLSLPIKK